MMKKVVSAIICLAMVLSLAVFAFPAYAETEGDFKYELIDGEVMITGYDGADGAVTIPATIGGYPVTSIGQNAFWSCVFITSIDIPDSVESIGVGAFESCTSLSSIELPDKITSISMAMFAGCSSLTSFTISDSITEIEDGAFEYCEGLSSIVIPDSVKSIGFSAFFGCTGLASITIPDSTKIENENVFNSTAYYNDETNWEDGVLYIGNHLYRAKSDISGSYTVKNGTVSICASAFNSCKDLEAVVIPDSTTDIGSLAFFLCSALASITLPDSIKHIGYGAFYSTAYVNNYANWSDNSLYIGNFLYSVLTGYSGEYTVRDGTVCICDEAFFGAWKITSITIPDSVVAVGNNVGRSCDGLLEYKVGDGNEYYKSVDGVLFSKDMSELVSYPAGKHATAYTTPEGVTRIGAYAFSTSAVLTAITISEGVTRIGKYAFDSCSELTSITLSDSVVEIGDSAFDGCEALASVVFPESVNFVGDNLFFNCYAINSVCFYNANCQICANSIPMEVAVYGFKNSTARWYADIYSNNFVEIVPSDITVTTPPTKLDYFVGDTFNSEGIVVTANYNDILTKSVTAELSAPDMTTAGTKTVTVTYEGKTASFDITVKAVELTGIAVTTLPTKLNYFVGDSFDSSGLVVTASYNNGTTEEVTASLSSPYMLSAGTKTVTAVFDGKTASFNITVKSVEMIGICVETPPTKLNYFVGDTFDSTGIVVIASYNNGKAEIVTAELSAPDMTTAGIKTIIVTYGEVKAAFDITVNARHLVGDVDLSGGITIADALTLFKHVAGVELLTNRDALTAADIDCNDGITIADALTLFKFVAGAISEY